MTPLVLWGPLCYTDVVAVYAGYCRISDDRAEEAGVERQRQDITRFVSNLGGDPSEIRWYIDNDVSAFKINVRRPEWDRLVADTDAGLITTIVGYNNDRLLRQPKQLEALIEIVERRKVRTYSVTGMFDLSNDAGILTARMLVAVANQESRNTQRRVLRAQLQLAEEGKPKGGGLRAYGFEPDGMTQRPEEVAVIRFICDRLINKVGLVEVTRTLNQTGVRPARAERWRPTAVRQIVLSPRIAGLRVHQGEIIGDACWEPIISREDFEAIQAIFNDPARKMPPGHNARSHLLSGFLTCSCGSPITAKSRASREGKTQYCCRSDRGGCGKVSRLAEPLEALVLKYIVAKAADEDIVEELDMTAEARLTKVDTEIEQLEKFKAAGDLTLADYVRLLKPLRAEQRMLNREVVVRSSDARMVGVDDVPSAWSDFTLAQRRALVRRWIETVIIEPVKKRGCIFEVETIHIVPRKPPASDAARHAPSHAETADLRP